jgi:hypothetical protein
MGLPVVGKSSVLGHNLSGPRVYSELDGLPKIFRTHEEGMKEGVSSTTVEFGWNMAGTTGLEPATSAVTGQRSNQLSYVPSFAAGWYYVTLTPARVRHGAGLSLFGFEPTPSLGKHPSAAGQINPTTESSLSDARPFWRPRGGVPCIFLRGKRAAQQLPYGDESPSALKAQVSSRE